jgi:hypothetical protein
MKKSSILLSLLICVSCNSLEHKKVYVEHPEKQAIDGIWNGGFDINGRGGFDFHAIHVQGRTTAVSYKAKAICIGSVEGGKGLYLSNYMLYSLDGAPFDSARLTGYLKEGKIESHFRTLSGGDIGAMNLEYNPVYEQPSSLELLQGDWQFVDRDGLTISISMFDGQWTGKDSDDCRYQGNMSVINPKYNAYDVTLTISACASVNGEYQGLAYLDEGNILRVDALNELYGFHFDFEKHHP